MKDNGQTFLGIKNVFEVDNFSLVMTHRNWRRSQQIHDLLRDRPINLMDAVIVVH